MKQIAWLILTIFLVFQIYDSSRKGDYQLAMVWTGFTVATGYARKKDLEGGKN